jgi:hypothetical protein
MGSRTQNLIVLDECIVEDWQGVKGDSFRIFYDEQRADFVVPSTIPNKLYPGPKVLGAPEAGLTNAQTWSKYKIAIGGQVAPCVKTRPTIRGLVCP